MGGEGRGRGARKKKKGSGGSNGGNVDLARIGKEKNGKEKEDS